MLYVVLLEESSTDQLPTRSAATVDLQGTLTQIYEAHGPAGRSVPPGRQLLSLGIPVPLVNP